MPFLTQTRVTEFLKVFLLYTIIVVLVFAYLRAHWISDAIKCHEAWRQEHFFWHAIGFIPDCGLLPAETVHHRQSILIHLVAVGLILVARCSFGLYCFFQQHNPMPNPNGVYIFFSNFQADYPLHHVVIDLLLAPLGVALWWITAPLALRTITFTIQGLVSDFFGMVTWMCHAVVEVLKVFFGLVFCIFIMASFGSDYVWVSGHYRRRSRW